MTKTPGKASGAATDEATDKSDTPDTGADTTAGAGAPDTTSSPTPGPSRTVAGPSLGDPVSAESGDGPSMATVVVDGDLPRRRRADELLIVVQSTKRESAETPKGEEDYATHRRGEMPPIAAADYPKGADVYFRMDADVDFGDVGDARILTSGHDLIVVGTEGLPDRDGQICIGPADPAYAAATWAYTQGADDIRIIGVEEERAKRLESFIRSMPEELWREDPKTRERVRFRENFRRPVVTPAD